ncbi:hypothetical protein NM208_g14545 [Fusarium decemcellulare]|uniref:Uncharacterized protein n=1 Tax=Fusarium decemcellulare TaxID=57161 RepID=A0ACC1RHG6_9HYPO|nr:hypothetical protein NM208_g14545 [Fusarium decemcellulare]
MRRYCATRHECAVVWAMGASGERLDVPGARAFIRSVHGWADSARRRCAIQAILAPALGDGKPLWETQALIRIPGVRRQRELAHRLPQSVSITPPLPSCVAPVDVEPIGRAAQDGIGDDCPLSPNCSGGFRFFFFLAGGNLETCSSGSAVLSLTLSSPVVPFRIL